MTGLTFTEGAWAPALAAAPIVTVVLVLLARRRARRASETFGPRARRLGAAVRPGARRALLVGAGTLLATVALLGPTWGEETSRVHERGVDVVVCLDVSQSMLARDERPTRLARAQREVRAFAEHARGARFALVVFAGEARLAVPLTRDAGSFADLAAQAEPSDVLRGGTNVGAALETALVAVRSRSGRPETIVVVTDGEDLSGRGRRVAETCRDRGVRVHCVGLGSPQGAKVVVADEKGRETFLRDRDGRDVVSAMDAGSLRRIAETTGGAFVPGHGRDGALVALYEDRILPAARRSLEDDARREAVPRFQVPLAAALLLWILDLWLARRD